LHPVAGMGKSRTALDTPLHDRLDKLALFEASDAPVISLYLDLRPSEIGRDRFGPFVRKALAARLKTYAPGSAALGSLERDRERIEAYLSSSLDPSANALALFASSGSALFEAFQLEAPLDDHSLFIGPLPHLYPLARLVDRYPRHAVVALDTHRARIFVFALGAEERRKGVVSPKTRRSMMGGWSQARYQRHADNIHLLHLKEVASALDRIVREENIDRVIVAGDDVVTAALRAELPDHLAGKIVDTLRLERDAGDAEIVRASLEVLHRSDAETDADRVQELIDAWRGNGLGVVGAEATLAAFELGQVDELLITTAPQELELPAPHVVGATAGTSVIETSAPLHASDATRVELAEMLVRRAHQTSAAVRFIEDPALLRSVGGVGALLRFRVRP
jgi:peptide chain release factor subunit 1